MKKLILLIPFLFCCSTNLDPEIDFGISTFHEFEQHPIYVTQGIKLIRNAITSRNYVIADNPHIIISQGYNNSFSHFLVYYHNRILRSADFEFIFFLLEKFFQIIISEQLKNDLQQNLSIRVTRQNESNLNIISEVPIYKINSIISIYSGTLNNNAVFGIIRH